MMQGLLVAECYESIAGRHSVVAAPPMVVRKAAGTPAEDSAALHPFEDEPNWLEALLRDATALLEVTGIVVDETVAAGIVDAVAVGTAGAAVDETVAAAGTALVAEIVDAAGTADIVAVEREWHRANAEVDQELAEGMQEHSEHSDRFPLGKDNSEKK